MTGANCRATAGFWPARCSRPPRSGKDERRLREEARQALDAVESAANSRRAPPLGQLLDRRRKRVALARALVAQPKTPVCSTSPPAAWPRTSSAELGELIRALAAQASLVIVEHHMDLMMSVCDLLVVLDFGKVISRGSPR